MTWMVGSAGQDIGKILALILMLAGVILTMMNIPALINFMKL
jgi:hypothetical protein